MSVDGTGNTLATVCQWFASCTNPATRLVIHPVLGPVPTCERCQRVVRQHPNGNH